MQSSVWGTAVTVLGSVTVAAVAFFLTRWKEIENDWRKRKLEHYKELFSAISEVAINNNDQQAHLRFAHAVNTVGLIAPQCVVSALMSFHNEIRFDNPNKSAQTHDMLLSQLLQAIRKDIGMKGDNSKTFGFHLVGSPPPAVSIDHGH